MLISIIYKNDNNEPLISIRHFNNPDIELYNNHNYLKLNMNFANIFLQPQKITKEYMKTKFKNLDINNDLIVLSY